MSMFLLLEGGNVELTDGDDLLLLGRLFTPPADPGPVFDMDAERVANRVAALFQLGVPQGRNVYLLRDGTVTEREPDDVTVTWDMVRRIFWGGRGSYSVSAEEAAALTAAGYEVVP